MSDPDTKAVHARIDRGTHHVVLPVAHADAVFSISGTWGDLDDYGPDATLVSLTCRTSKASRYTEHRLMHDTSFPLPAGTIQLELRVLASCPGTSLTVTVAPVSAKRAALATVGTSRSAPAR